MRVTGGRCHPFTDTRRKRAALRRKQRLDRENLSLRAELVTEAHPTGGSMMEVRRI